MQKVVFASTSITAPYVIKKVKAFRNAGYDTVLYSYNIGPQYERAGYQDIGPVVDLGYIKSGHGYIKNYSKIFLS